MRLLTSLALITIAYAALTRVNKLHTARFHGKPAARRMWRRSCKPSAQGRPFDFFG